MSTGHEAVERSEVQDCPARLHFEVVDGVHLLAECRRILAPIGVLRIATPSQGEILEKSCRGDWRDQDWLTWPAHRSVATRAEMLNAVFRWWGHLLVYDRKELYRRLREAGFTTMREAACGTSDEEELRDLETRIDSLLICEALR